MTSHSTSKKKTKNNIMTDGKNVSDNLSHISLPSGALQYGAQVAVQKRELGETIKGKVNPDVASKDDKPEKDSKADSPGSNAVADVDVCKHLKAEKCSEVVVRRMDDERLDTEIRGIIHLPCMVVAVDHTNMKLKAFSSSGGFLSSAKLKAETWGITLVSDLTFATCGCGNKIYLWELDGKKKIKKQKTFKVDYNAYGTHFNDTFYCVLHRYDGAIAILDPQGKKVKQIFIKEAFGKEIIFGWDINMDRDTHNIYVPCVRACGILCLTMEGLPLWFTSLNYPKGITEIGGMLCVAENHCERLQLISKGGECRQVLLDTEALDGIPMYICNGENRKLYVSFHGSINYIEKRHLISVFSISNQ